MKIRSAQKSDMQGVLNLIMELAHFEKEPEAVEIGLSDLQKDGFGSQPKFHCFIAEEHAEIVGIALVYMRYSTWKGPALHLEDLIVTEKARGKGVGTKLLDEVVTYAKRLGVRRLGWEVLDWNTPAIEFYKSKGAKVLTDWHVVQLDAEGIDAYIKNLE